MQENYSKYYDIDLWQDIVYNSARKSQEKKHFSTPRFGISVNYALTQLQNTFVEKWSKIPNTKCNYTSLVEHTKKEPRNYSTDWRSILKYSSARSCYTLDLIFRTCLRAYVLLRIRWIQPVLDYMYIYICVCILAGRGWRSEVYWL